MTGSTALYTLGFILLFVGVALIILAIVLITVKHGAQRKTKTAGVIFVGPIPIIFGSDTKSIKEIIVFSIVLTAVLIAGTLLYYILLR